MWFRYYLQQHLEHAMSEIEAKEGTYSLEFNRDGEDDHLDGGALDARGALVERPGRWWASDLKGCRNDVDLSQMDLAWVRHTEDPLFADFSCMDRLLLYLVFVRELHVGKSGECAADP